MTAVIVALPRRVAAAPAATESRGSAVILPFRRRLSGKTKALLRLIDTLLTLYEPGSPDHAETLLLRQRVLAETGGAHPTLARWRRAAAARPAVPSSAVRVPKSCSAARPGGSHDL